MTGIACPACGHSWFDHRDGQRSPGRLGEYPRVVLLRCLACRCVGQLLPPPPRPWEPLWGPETAEDPGVAPEPTPASGEAGRPVPPANPAILDRLLEPGEAEAWARAHPPADRDPPITR